MKRRSSPVRITSLDWQPPPDYDFTRPTCLNYRVEGSRETVGDFARIRSDLDFDYHGCYSPSRQRVQDIIVRDTIGSGTVHKNPWLIFTAGAMGAGKGHTVDWMSAEALFPLPDIVHVDPDKFRRELPEWRGYLERDRDTAGSMTQRESGYLVEVSQEAAMRQGKNVWVDGSMRNADWYEVIFANIRRKFPNYRIAILHVFAPLDVVLARAKARAKTTGRVVPEEAIRASYDQVPASVERLTPFADFVAHIENETVPRLVKCVGPKVHVEDSCDWAEIRNRFAELPELDLRDSVRVQILRLVKEHPVLVFSKTYCSHCAKVRQILTSITTEQNIKFVQLDALSCNGYKSSVEGAVGVPMQLELSRMTGRPTVPNVYLKGSHLGGCDEVEALNATGELAILLSDALGEGRLLSRVAKTVT